MPEIDQLAEQRRLIEERYQGLRDYWNDPQQTAMYDQLQGRASGATQPFGASVVNAQLSQNADAGAAGHAANQQSIQRAFANSGLSGSGLQASATVNSRRKTQASVRTGRNQITSRAALENFQAQERAQQQLQSYTQQRYQALQQATAMENDYRQKLHATGDASNVAQVTGTDPAAPQASAAQPAQPAQPQRAMPQLPAVWQMKDNPLSAGTFGSPAHGAFQSRQGEYAQTNQRNNNFAQQNYQAQMARWFSGGF